MPKVVISSNNESSIESSSDSTCESHNGSSNHSSDHSSSYEINQSTDFLGFDRCQRLHDSQLISGAIRAGVRMPPIRYLLLIFKLVGLLLGKSEKEEDDYKQIRGDNWSNCFIIWLLTVAEPENLNWGDPKINQHRRAQTTTPAGGSSSLDCLTKCT
ncbi:hypothetical protein Fot_34983 [Forsythia ovata]|uniref:Uncharacterized protein n=1 Tax=Forsythia ovata TaxID=205694 RepID=A0ABD1SKJ0_9LAMI